MAEGEDGGWWGGWLQQSFQSVRHKSAEALEFIRRDLAEFSQVVQHDTANTIAATAHAVKEKLVVEGSSGATDTVKKGLSNILGVITDTLAPPPDKTIDCDVITLVATPSGTTEVYDSTKARLYSLQADPATYCNEPDGPPELFEAWLSQFDLELKKMETSELLVTSPSVRALYTKMVPAAVSHTEFWQRYFYKLYQLEQEEARRGALKQRAEQTTHTEELGWEEEDEFVGASSPSRLDLNSVVCTSSVLQECRTPESNSDFTESAKDDIPEEQETTVSESSESITLVTQVEKPASVTSSPLPSASKEVTGDICKKLLDASLEERNGSHKSSEEQETKSRMSDPETQELKTTSEPSSTLGSKGLAEPKGSSKPETVREEGPTDLRVFELNSDSGKSTPSNNGKKGSSTDISEDWEKEFDLDMTEEEVQQALSKVEDSEEDWEDWE
ncbi:BSD domain-containing protein 1 [Protopterus annectens]|uniref:BSD domain-containing protein 1 n=1 Tax=Protopterus annectens TaxID=7888 RepID=UPI001CF9C440|nr:BSD domain-containing protein 1 [Protopterus annectens]